MKLAQHLTILVILFSFKSVSAQPFGGNNSDHDSGQFEMPPAPEVSDEGDYEIVIEEAPAASRTLYEAPAPAPRNISSPRPSRTVAVSLRAQMDAAGYRRDPFAPQIRRASAIIPVVSAPIPAQISSHASGMPVDGRLPEQKLAAVHGVLQPGNFNERMQATGAYLDVNGQDMRLERQREKAIITSRKQTENEKDGFFDRIGDGVDTFFEGLDEALDAKDRLSKR